MEDRVKKDGKPPAPKAPLAKVNSDAHQSKESNRPPVVRGSRASVASLLDDDSSSQQELDMSWEFDVMQIVRARSTDDLPASAKLLNSFSSSLGQSSAGEDFLGQEKEKEKLARSSLPSGGWEQKRQVIYNTKKGGWGNKSQRGQLLDDTSVATATTTVMDESAQAPTLRRVYSNQCPPEKFQKQLHQQPEKQQPRDPQQSSAEFELMKIVESRARAARLEMQEEEEKEEILPSSSSIKEETEEFPQAIVTKNGVPITPLKGQQPGAYAQVPGEAVRRMDADFQLSNNDSFANENGFEIDQTYKSYRDEMDLTCRSQKSRKSSATLPLAPAIPAIGIPLVEQGTNGARLLSRNYNIDSEDPDNTNTQQLAVADPVNDEFHAEDLPQAVEWSGTRRERMKKGMPVPWSGGMCVLLLTTVLLVIFFTASNDGHSSMVVRVVNETTMAPTSAPIEDKLLMLLPNETLQAMRQDDSPQSKAFQWILGDPHYLEFYSDERLVQRFALATLYYSTGGDEWYNKTNWVSYQHHECNWFSDSHPHMWGYGGEDDPLYEVTALIRPCRNMSNLLAGDDGGEYEHLWLSQNNLEGSIPPELYLLTSLRSISILGNALSGSISAAIGQLRNLEAITVGPNSLTGRIPSEIGLCSHLSVLAILNNQIGGSLPTELGNLGEMKYFMADTNRITGPIPTALTKLTKLQMLYLYNNVLTGPILAEVSEMKNLKDLQIHLNHFSGSIPSTLGELKQLEALSLRGNLLTGTVPSELGELVNLELLNIRSNRLTGKIPPSIGNLKMLFYLSMAHNQISGSIPSQIFEIAFVGNPGNFSMTALGKRSGLPGGVLQLHNTSISGSIPSELGQSSGIAWLHVNDNAKLTGRIPSELGMLSNLELVDLFTSSLSGRVPSEVGTLLKLTEVRLDNSLLTGALPSELGLLHQMAVFNASNNFLSGTVPEEVGGLVGGNLKYWNISDNAFSGVVPEELCDLRATSSLGFDCSFLLCGCHCLCNLW